MRGSFRFTNPGSEIESRAGQLLAQMARKEIICDLEGSFRLGA